MDINWTTKALSDVARLYDFLSSVNPTAAAKVVQSLVQAPVVLQNYPRMGEQLFQFLPREIRRVIISEYEIRYEIHEMTVYVLRLWHTREER